MFPRRCSRGAVAVFVSLFISKFLQCLDLFFSKHLQNKPEMINERDYYGDGIHKYKRITAIGFPELF